MNISGRLPLAGEVSRNRHKHNCLHFNRHPCLLLHYLRRRRRHKPASDERRVKCRKERKRVRNGRVNEEEVVPEDDNDRKESRIEYELGRFV